VSELQIYLVRHGESASNFHNTFIGRSDDPPLTEKGIAQVKRLAQGWKGMNFSVIFSSPLTGAKQTAEILAEALHLDVIYDEDLKEVNLGVLDGRAIHDPGCYSLYDHMVRN